MQYYAIQVQASRENKFIERGNSFLDEFDSKLFAPQRELKTRKQGVVKKKLYSIFPGYVFLETPEFSISLYKKLKRVKYFTKILPTSGNPMTLKNSDLGYIKHFMNFDNVAKISKAKFDENNRIVILQGALTGLEGKIVKVDRRKGRATVRLDLYENSHDIIFGFELIENINKVE